MQALKADSTHGNCLNLIGAIHMKSLQFSEAAEFFSRAVAAMPLDLDTRNNLATALLKDRSYVRAANEYMRIVAIDPSRLDQVAAAKHLSRLAHEALVIPDIETAAEALAGAAFLDHEFLSRPDMKIKDAAVEIRLLEAMHRRAPDQPAISEKLAMALHRVGQTEKSLAIFDQLAVRLGGKDSFSTDFHRIYNAGLIATNSRVRFQRRLRFQELATVFARVANVEGDIAECGCAKGLSAFVIASLKSQYAPSFRGKGFHIFDSFAGLSEPNEKDLLGASGVARVNMKPGQYAASLDTVKKGLAAFPEIEFHPGWIPSRFRDVEQKSFKFLNLDVDLYEPTRQSILFFFPRMVTGGLIVSDDYNWPGCRRAIEECSRELGFTFVLTPHNQAIISKKK